MSEISENLKPGGGYSAEEILYMREHSKEITEENLSELRKFINKDVRNKNLEVISNYKDGFTKLLDLLKKPEFLKKYPNIDSNLVNSLNISSKRDCMKIIQIALGMTGTDVDGVYGKDTFKAILDFQLTNPDYISYKCDKEEENDKCPLVEGKADAIIGLGMIFALGERLEEGKLEILPEKQPVKQLTEKTTPATEKTIEEQIVPIKKDGKPEEKEVLKEENKVLELLEKGEITSEDLVILLGDEKKLEEDLVSIFKSGNKEYISKLEKIFFFDYKLEKEKRSINIILLSLKNLKEGFEKFKNMMGSEQYVITPIDITKDANKIDDFLKIKYGVFQLKIYMDGGFALLNDKGEFLNSPYKFQKNNFNFYDFVYIENYISLSEDYTKKILIREQIYKYDILELLLPINRPVLENTLKNIYKDENSKYHFEKKLGLITEGFGDFLTLNNFSLENEDDFVKKVIEKLEEKSKEEENKPKK